MTTLRTDPDTVVLLPQAAGIALIPKPTPLTRLNYFDGKFLRASDLTAEQDYHRQLQRLATRAGGSGVVHGFDLLQLAGDQLELGAGLAIDPEGRVLYLPMDAAVQIEELIRRSVASPLPQAGAGAGGPALFSPCESAALTGTVAPVVAGTSLYVIGLSLAEALCGQEDVFGKPCESACASGTERPQRLEGVVLRALPLQLASPLPDSRAETMQTPLHLRSRVASAWFADEARQVDSLINGAGLRSSLWCRAAAPTAGGFVPLAVLARAGGHTLFLDAWTARRERMDGPPRRYWQWRMAMRPWDAFLAQLLQFQCQLRDAWARTPVASDDPCAELRKTVLEVGDILGRLDQQYQASAGKLALREPAAATASPEPIPLSRTLLASAVKRANAMNASQLVLQPSERVLIRRGIVELPPAGYLPVAPGSAFTVNEQLRRLMGEGVDLRFCVVRPDVVPHALEEAQHMQRISLLRGLDNPQQKEEVDILVPDGQIIGEAADTGAGWEVRLASTARSDLIVATKVQRDVMTGAARSERRGDGGLGFCFAGLLETASKTAALSALKAWAAERDNGLEQTLWKAVDLRQAVEPAGQRGAAAAAAATTEPTPAQLSAHFSALREEALAYRLKTVQRVASTATSAGIRHFEGLDLAAGGKDSEHTALWLALRSEADPLAAAEGSRVDMSLDLSLLSPKSGGTLFVDIGIVGAQLIVESRVSSGQRLTVQGTLRGAAIIAGLVGTLANAQRGLHFSVPVLISSEPVDGGRQVTVEADFSELLFDGRGFMGLDRLGLQLHSGADEQGRQQVELKVQTVAQGVALDLGARLLRNEAVLKPGHALRATSETAIDVLATRESAPNFAVQARAELFGQPAAPVQDALSVRATLDWVLFQRRRTRQCGAAPAAAVLEPRRYELHHLKAASEEQLRSARAAVLGANAAAIRKLGFAPIAAVSFEGGRSSLATPTAELLQDWAAAQPGARLRFGAIGSQGAAQAEGEALAQARLAGLELTLSQGQLDRATENQVLPVLPALGLAGWDGAIFLISDTVATVCHDLLALDSVEALKRFVALLRRGGLAAAMQQMELRLLAHVDFAADGRSIPAAGAQALKAAWGNAGAPGPLALVLHGSTTTDALAQQRTQALLQQLGGSGISVEALLASDLEKVSTCAGLSVLVRPPVVSEPVPAPAPVPTPVPVRQDLALLGFVLYDGRFIFLNGETVFSKQQLADLKPADLDGFAAALKQLTASRQPVRLSVGVQQASLLADGQQLLDAVEQVAGMIGYGGFRFSEVLQLTAEDIKAIESFGFPRASWQFAILPNPRGG